MSLPISGFTAVPNPMMLSFLATQGFAIMYYGGAGWQFGKRKVSGMTNEEVNAMSPNEFLIKLHSETKTMVPTMQRGMEDMTPLIHTTMTQFGAYIREAIKAFPETVSNILGTPTEFKNIPTTDQTGGNLPPQMASFLHYFKTLSDATKVPTNTIQTRIQQDFGKRIAKAGATIRGDEAPTNLVPYKGKWYTVQRLQQLIDAQAGAVARAEIRSIPPQISKATLAEPKRMANQSAKLERAKLLQEIRQLGHAVTVLARGEQYKSRQFAFHTGQLEDAKISLQRRKQLLANLLARYRFT